MGRYSLVSLEIVRVDMEAMSTQHNAIKIVYEAKSILLAYNEVGLKGESASVHFLHQGSPNKQPVFEVKIEKNKFSSRKDRLFFEFYPEIACFEEATPEAAKYYNNLVYSNS